MNNSNDTLLAVAIEQIRALTKTVESHEKQIDEIQKERNKALVWGIITLTGTLGTVLMWSVNFVKDHLK